LPPANGDAPLDELTRDELSVFLYAALLPDETLRIVRDLRLSVPGFRTEALSEPERCDLIADELRAAPEERWRVLDALRSGFGRPPLVAVALDELGARDLLDVGTTEHGTILAIWRVLADPSPTVRALARPLLAGLVGEYYGPPPDADAPGGETQGGSTGAPAGDTADAEVRAESLARELSRARAQAERLRTKGDERAEKLQAQLKEARAGESRAVAEAARAREAAELSRRAMARAEEGLASALATDLAVEGQRLRQEGRELAGKLAAAEARAERAELRGADLEKALEAARAQREPIPAPMQPTGEEGTADDSPATWLLPVYSREFYDSLARWDRRIQRAAFKQAHLLAQDHRHPSLRALPLEGLPGYYRVRVATDVRLIYRRGEQQGAVEILSLIDREDLDRYIRQAKTRD
jgi:mRNA-degrading endonuclease RelE of RelBE toxin-antitoxin system